MDNCSFCSKPSTEQPIINGNKVGICFECVDLVKEMKDEYNPQQKSIMIEDNRRNN